ncbi:PP2C family serine/threonine-protein phosphatase [Pedobacter gandavensis]|uniref:PP2C family serine/threonine-protein phosphatase n=1 Tax=Pedobacter gandavensis TaxID=2679963 RepID=UPI00292FFC76|nr:PP2C family serine/threonine-protein phosphatase [Pedobacter gandavensis]
MTNINQYINQLFSVNEIKLDENKRKLFESYIIQSDVADLINQISKNQQLLMDKWALLNRSTSISEQIVRVPNGIVGKPYFAVLDFDALGWIDLQLLELKIQAETGLFYAPEQKAIMGTPTSSGDYKIELRYQLNESADQTYLKEIAIVINPDPKSLWKNLECDEHDIYYKPDIALNSGTFSDKHFVVASKRGRSHANIGGFREDHYVLESFEETGWNLIALADGAGSAKYSRKGSALACESIGNYFREVLTTEITKEIVELRNSAVLTPSELILDIMKSGVAKVHSDLAKFALENHSELKDFHTTLIFVLLKKIGTGYLILSFGVGDCPMAVVNKAQTQVTLLNNLDVGAYGGGTRFITMPEIFSSGDFEARFTFRFQDDFSFMFLMTDGIFDPKFETEAALTRIENWQKFINDLNGQNESKSRVDFSIPNPELSDQLSQWMDFWSQGNHDDRTLAIFY